MATWRRKRKRAQWTGFVEYSGNAYEEKEDMAHAGGTTAAYRCTVLIDDDGGQLRTSYTTYPRTLCATVDDAVQRLKQGESVTVAENDMAALRTRLAEHGIAQEAAQ